MNKMLKYGLPSMFSLALAVPAMAQTTPGPYQNRSGSNSGSYQNPQNAPGQSAAQTGQNNAAATSQPATATQNQNPNWQSSRNGGNQGFSQDDHRAGNSEVSERFMANVQRHLQQQGFYHEGNIDGRWGPETSRAVGAFQQQHNLPRTGQLNRPTLEALNVMHGAQPDANDMQQGTHGAQGNNGMQQGTNGMQQSANGAQGTNGGAQNPEVTNSRNETNNPTPAGNPNTASQTSPATSPTGSNVANNGQGGTPLTESQIRSDLTNSGYSNIHALQQSGDTYSATAEKNGQAMNLTVDARTGNVIKSTNSNG